MAQKGPKKNGSAATEFHRTAHRAIRWRLRAFPRQFDNGVEMHTRRFDHRLNVQIDQPLPWFNRLAVAPTYATAFAVIGGELLWHPHSSVYPNPDALDSLTDLLGPRVRRLSDPQ